MNFCSPPTHPEEGRGHLGSAAAGPSVLVLFPSRQPSLNLDNPTSWKPSDAWVACVTRIFHVVHRYLAADRTTAGGRRPGGSRVLFPTAERGVDG